MLNILTTPPKKKVKTAIMLGPLLKKCYKGQHIVILEQTAGQVK